MTGDGIPVAGAATAANIDGTLVFERLFLSALAVMATAANASRFGDIATVFADKGHDAKGNLAEVLAKLSDHDLSAREAARAVAILGLR